MPAGRYRIASGGQPNPTGVTGSYLITVASVAKPNSANAPYCIPNELICANLGRFLYLPIPPSGVVEAPSTGLGPWFASLNFNLTDNSLPPIDPPACEQYLPDLTTGVCLYDILIANPDRHRRNLSVDDRVRPTTMNVFDHSHALFGVEPGSGTRRLSNARSQLAISKHCLLGIIRTDQYFEKWISRIEAIPDFYIDEICGEAVGLGIDGTEADMARNFLKERRSNFRSLIAAQQSAFASITQWSLPLWS